jgi:3'-phosphoadenosine 5'-phosphosulfate sulfotransferase (PAPS reductase)/FAD synthetase
MKDSLTIFSFADQETGWNNPSKTKRQKELLRFRGNLLNMRMKYPLEHKIELAKVRIRTAIRKYGKNNCYVSFSGGKDSAVISHLVLSMGYKLEHVFSNTRLEYPECVSFAREWCKKYGVRLTMVMPEVMPIDVWKKYGYPMFSKEIATILERVRTHRKVNPKKLKKVKNFLKYKHVPISARCCDYLKRRPMLKWQEKSGKKVAIMGTRAEESRIRRVVWIRKGCIYETKKQVVVTPIIFFTEEDIWEYVNKYKIKLADIYYNGIKRNGCYCCGFGCHLSNENNFVKLKKLNPKLWEHVMNDWNFREICEQCGVRTE